MLKTGALAVAAFTLSLIACDLALRAATPYPAPIWTGDRPRHTTPDALKGYRLDPALPDVGADGWRRVNGPEETAAPAAIAIGDSHSYGSHVLAADAWPALLARFEGARVENWSAPSFGIFSYHALVRQALDRGAERILVGLFPGNDFFPTFSHCVIAFDEPFWRTEIAALGAAPPICRQRPARQGSLAHRVKRALERHSAIVQIVDARVLQPYKHLIGDARGVGLFEGGLAFMRRDDAAYYARAMDLDDRDVAAMRDAFRAMAARWRAWADEAGAEIGVVILPTRERAIARYVRDRRGAPVADPVFVADLAIQERLMTEIATILDDASIARIDATPFLVEALAAAEAESDFALANFYVDSHPAAAGQRAYGDAARALWAAMAALERSEPERAAAIER